MLESSMEHSSMSHSPISPWRSLSNWQSNLDAKRIQKTTNKIKTNCQASIQINLINQISQIKTCCKCLWSHKKLYRRFKVDKTSHSTKLVLCALFQAPQHQVELDQRRISIRLKKLILTIYRWLQMDSSIIKHLSIQTLTIWFTYKYVAKVNWTKKLRNSSQLNSST